MSNITVSTHPETNSLEIIINNKRERLIDDRDTLLALVKEHKTQLQASLERRCNQGQGSAKAIRQTIAAIRHGQEQIALIDMQLESISAPDESAEEKKREEAEFDQYCEERRELNAIDAQIRAEHGWPAEEGWPAIPPSLCKACGADATCWVAGVSYCFGTEWWRLCDRCAERVSGPSPCGWCKQEVDELRPTHHWEECAGFGPPVYWICAECAKKEGESFDEATASLPV